MEDYLKDVRYALTSLIALVWLEKNELDELIRRKDRLESKLDEHSKVFELLSSNPDLDDEGIGTMLYWSIRHDIIPELNEIERSILNITEQIINKEYSINQLSNSILQITKQAIVRIFNNLDSCPDGRTINTFSIKELIWHGRNQATHIEETDLHQPTIDFFQRLMVQYPNTFDEFKSKSMPFNILEVLDWRTYENIKNDLMLFESA